MRDLAFGQSIRLKRISDSSGVIDVLEFGELGIAKFQRMYMLHSVVEGSTRGGHAHRELEQYVIAASGSFTLHLTRFGQKRTVVIDSPEFAYYIPPLTWRDLDNFSVGAVCLVLASAPYVEGDYIRDYGQFIEASQAAQAVER